MRIGVLGTGMVGQAIATKLAEKNDVMVGSRDRNNLKAKAWIEKVSKMSLGTFEEAAQFGEVIFNCTKGSATLAAFSLAGEKALGNKVVIDTANPLEFSPTHEVSLFVSNTDSLAEQLQRTYPQIKVVKTLNTMTASLMVNPSLLPGKHSLFLAGNHDDAKKKVMTVLESNFGWKPESFIDLGDITGARSLEMLVTVWVRLWNHYQNPLFNFSIITP